MSSASSSSNLLAPSSATNNISIPLAVPQKLQSSGSATGNPRNKCALKPGHSLMDWVRLGNSGVDLAGTRGRVVPVSVEELAKHNKQNDAWMAIRGKVYNVTRYMDFHPGGVDELMRGVGRDATKLFDEVHAWVNYQQLLAKCYIGPLKHVVKIDTDLLKSLKSKSSQDFASLPPPAPKANPLPDVIPRLDWIQKRGDLTFYIYTRQYCNPGLILQSKHDKQLLLRVLIGYSYHEFNVELQNSVEWPPKSLQIASESGKIELIFKKSIEELWTTYGSHTSRQMSASDMLLNELQFDFKVLEKQDFNHDSFELVVDTAHNLMYLPLGYHLSMVATVNGSEVTRSYTPVDAKYLQLTKTASMPWTTLCFLIKSYKDGLISSHLQQLQPNVASIQLSAPKGNFQWAALAQHISILLLAAGSGITPMLSLIEPLLKRNTKRLQHLTLLYFNKTEQDIWCRKQLEQLSTEDERFSVQHILSQANENSWTGLKGRISSELLQEHIGTAEQQQSSDKTKATFVLVCGPNAFNQQAIELLEALGVKSECIHVFQ